MRKAVTFVEVLVIICIVGVLAMLLVPAVMQTMRVTTASSDSHHIEIFQCVKTYVLNHGDYNPEFKVNLRKLNSQEVIVFKTEESVFAQFQPEKYYEVNHYVFLGINYIRSAKFLEKTVAENGEPL